MSRLLSSFSFPAHILSKLYSAHYNTVSDLLQQPVSQVCADTELCNSDVDYMYQLIKSSNAPNNTEPINPTDRSQLEEFHKNIFTQQSALSLLYSNQQNSSSRLTTLCESINKLLDGGLCNSTTYEFCGTPGIGKTQLLLQLCCTVQLPNALGGVNGNALFIDTEGMECMRRVSIMLCMCIYSLYVCRSHCIIQVHLHLNELIILAQQ